MLAAPRPFRRSRLVSVLRLLLCLLLCLAGGAGPVQAGEERVPKGATRIERYPPSFRLRVKEAIERGSKRILAMQTLEGVWGDPKHVEVMGHTALPLLTLLKAGVAPDQKSLQLAFTKLSQMEPTRTYSVGIFLMTLHARYQPKLDTQDDDVDTARAERLQPRKIWQAMSTEDRALVEKNVAFLLRAQNASGLWHYEPAANVGDLAHDLSCSQYALLGLRAAMDCGVKVSADVWRAAFAGLLKHQDDTGPEVELLDYKVRGTYAFQSSTPAEARGFHYRDSRTNGPQGENTLWAGPATGSMTTAGVACLEIVAEGLWRSRKFRGKERKRVKEGVRDGLAWMQEHFDVEKNPTLPAAEGNHHHFYYLYGLERMGMLTSRRWLGTHDWYKEGADLLLARQQGDGSWGNHVQSSYAVLFLKRATRPADRVVTTD
jgi:hypothetical protein